MAKKCPNCGKVMEDFVTFYICDDCDELIYKRGYKPKEDRDHIPMGCAACGNPAYPDCKLSCSLFDD